MYREASSWMNVKEKTFEKDVIDVEVHAESSWMLQRSVQRIASTTRRLDSRTENKLLKPETPEEHDK